jgi:hypothetical protein
MATTTNYGWTTPDDTALVKDGAAAIRTLGSSVDTTTKALNPSTTLGDIEYRSSTANTNTRLGIGTTGQVLTVAGGVPSWGAPPATGANYTLLNTGGTALTGAATVTVSGISGVSNLLLVIDDVSATTNATLGFRINTDTGGTQYKFKGFRTPNGTSNAEAEAGFYYLGSVDGGAAVGDYAVHIFGCSTTGFKTINSLGFTTGSDQTFQTNGIYFGTAAVSSVSIFTNGGTLDAGTLFVYGG